MLKQLESLCREMCVKEDNNINFILLLKTSLIVKTYFHPNTFTVWRPWLVHFSSCMQRMTTSCRITWAWRYSSSSFLLPLTKSLWMLQPLLGITLHFFCLQLYQISLQTKKIYNSDVQVEMITYNAKLGLSHNNIYLDPNLSDVVG